MRIEMPWENYLLKNQAFSGGNPRYGHTAKCQKAMDDIFYLVKEQGGFTWHGGRLKITITAYVDNLNIDAQNLVDAVSDALEVALRVNDKHFDMTAIRELDREKPRIVMEIEEGADEGN